MLSKEGRRILESVQQYATELFGSLSRSEPLRVPMASHPRILDALICITPLDGDPAQIGASEALDNISSVPEACSLWAAQALEEGLAIPLCRHRLCFTNPGVPALRSICAVFDESLADCPHERFRQLCDIVVAGEGDSRSEWALIQVRLPPRGWPWRPGPHG